VAASPCSPGNAVLVPAPLRTRIPQQQQSPQEQERPLDRSDSLSRSGSSRIPSALSPQPQQLQQQQAAVGATRAAADVNSASMGTGLDVLLSGTRRRSSSDNGSSASSRRGSMTGAGPRDDAASAAWMSSLRSAAPSSSGSKRSSRLVALSQVLLLWLHASIGSCVGRRWCLFALFGCKQLVAGTNSNYRSCHGADSVVLTL
jgi:hypothetical protein